jgi:hypothetical protein
METKFIRVVDRQDIAHYISSIQIVKITDLISSRSVCLSDNTEISTLQTRAQIIGLITV